MIGKGAWYFTPSGGGSRRHMGNAASAEITANIETLAHYSSMSGIKTKDREVAVQKSGVVKIVLEEWTAKNLALALMASEGQNTAGELELDIMSEDLIRGVLEFEAANTVGPQWDYYFPSVAFKPSGAVSPISEEWGTIEVEGELEAVDGSFGKATLSGVSTDTEQV
jgi:hypothetical protein